MDLSTTIRKVKFKHYIRSANSAAHELARFSFCSKNSVSWLSEPLGLLINTLVNDKCALIFIKLAMTIFPKKKRYRSLTHYQEAFYGTFY